MSRPIHESYSKLFSRSLNDKSSSTVGWSARVWKITFESVVREPRWMRGRWKCQNEEKFTRESREGKNGEKKGKVCTFKKFSCLHATVYPNTSQRDCQLKDFTRFFANFNSISLDSMRTKMKTSVFLNKHVGTVGCCTRYKYSVPVNLQKRMSERERRRWIRRENKEWKS